jgi:hypothetical protein
MHHHSEKHKVYEVSNPRFLPPDSLQLTDQSPNPKAKAMQGISIRHYPLSVCAQFLPAIYLAHVSSSPLKSPGEKMLK